MGKTDKQITNEELGILLFKRLELKYQGQLKTLRKKHNEFERIVFSWNRNTMETIDKLKKELEELRKIFGEFK